MQKKINRYMFVSSILAVVIALSILMFVLYTHFVKIEMNGQKIKLNLIKKSYSLNGLSYFNDLNSFDDRITIIAKDGTVIFDNEVNKDQMENHFDRKEVKQAVKDGYSSTYRFSNTKYEYRLYSAMKLDDGTIIRISKPSITLLKIIINVLKSVAIILILVTLFTAVYSKKLSSKILTPINNVDLDKPLNYLVYDELSPLFYKIDRQIKNLEVKNSEIKYITENVSDGIIIISHDKKALRVNNIAYLLTGVKENEYYLNNCRIVEFKKAVENALTGVNSTYKIKVKDSMYLLISSAVKLENDKFGVFVSFRNVDEEENREKMRREFTANVSHELKTPLTSIMGTAELFMKDMISSKDVNKFGTKIYSESARLLDMIENMLKLSKIDESRTEMDFENVNLNNVITKVLNNLEESLNRKNLKVMTVLDNINVVGVKTLLYDLFFNLVDNAVKYSTFDSNIYINSQILDNGDYHLSIRDEGIGIAEKELKNIFERFYRVDKSHSKATGGSGLGLSIVKHISIIHGYDIEVKSLGENQGSEFIVIIPKNKCS